MSAPTLVESTTHPELVPCQCCQRVSTREHYEYTLGKDSYAPCCLFCLPRDIRVVDDFELHERLSGGRLRKCYGAANAMYQVVTRHRLACIQRRENPGFTEQVIKILTYHQWQKLNSGDNSQHHHDQVPESVERVLVLPELQSSS